MTTILRTWDTRQPSQRQALDMTLAMMGTPGRELMQATAGLRAALAAHRKAQAQPNKYQTPAGTRAWVRKSLARLRAARGVLKVERTPDEAANLAHELTAIRAVA